LGQFILSEAIVNNQSILDFIISIYNQLLLKRELSKMLEKASELSEDQKYSQALKYYENVLRVDPVNITAIIDYGVTLQNLAYLKRALEMYDMALTIQPKNISALINKGTVLHTMEKYSEAISCYDIVLRLDERNTMTAVCKGLSLGEMGNIKLAIKYFKKALSIDSQHELAQISLSTAIKIIK